MDRVRLEELKMDTRDEMLRFLKKLWKQEDAECPMCGNRLELLHKKAKKSNCDWQCKSCDKIFKTIYLLDELNGGIGNE
ncbi:MAG: hypothetical protein IKL04_04410 [Lachnospiraceae bacterium]|nr:hypothetical protein [Lachnospiraceae bacterium]